MKAAVVLAAALAATSAHAGFWTGNQLLAAMNGETVDKMMALGYVVGTHDTLDGIVVCSPASVTAGQVRDIVRRALEQSPEDRHRNANMLIAGALQSTWPCKKAPTPKGGDL